MLHPIAVLVGLLQFLSCWNSHIRATTEKQSLIEAPDIIQLDVAGLPSDIKKLNGEFLVRPDGKVYLDSYGSVKVAGLTLEEASDAVRLKLADVLDVRPKSLTVMAKMSEANSKFYYLVTPFAGGGMQVTRYSAKKGDTVLDALLKSEEAAANAANGKIWIERRSQNATQILPIDWAGLTQKGMTRTNYLLAPGDVLNVHQAKAEPKK